MYTSGSTGRPKGVIVPHRAIVRLVRDQNYMDFSSNEVFLLISSLAFDASTWEVWGALLNGGRLAVVTSPHLSIDQIAEAISVYGVTSMFLTSALFHAVVDHNVSALRGVRQLIVGGDVLSSLHSQKAMSSLPDCQLINGYGPTEATTFSLCYRLPRHECADASIPIGRPIAHSAAYILDERLCPVPDGEVGSLWIGGDGVAKGYLKRPELDAERFRVDPFTNDGSLMYLTGDLASRRSDGEFEFLGRNDRQVKINGKRIELDEIEHVLRRDHRLADAIVVLRKESEDSKKIVAFLKPASLSAANGLVDFVLQDLRQRLPPHMVPHETALVEKFPLTSNGKVDRNALLEMVRQPVTSPLGGAIGTGLEKAISEIWERALARPVTSEANFFDLGGTSLQMIRVHAELRSAIAPNVAIIDLFAHPTVAGLARFLEGGPGRTVCSEPRCVGTNTPQNKPHASAGPNWDKPRDIASLRAKILRATRA
jgi:acyl-coenzyme A synthetase/AMP-(fatty) acid ligase